MVPGYVVHIRKEATGEIRRYTDGLEWLGDFIWSEGNFACDCNRHLFFEHAAGNEPAESHECGSVAYSVKIEDEAGNELYGEW